MSAIDRKELGEANRQRNATYYGETDQQSTTKYLMGDRGEKFFTFHNG